MKKALLASLVITSTVLAAPAAAQDRQGSATPAPPASPPAGAPKTAPVLIVDVSAAGDLDADAIRTAIGRELHVAAAASSEPIAGQAIGRISILVRDKTALVTFRKTDADPPIARTVSLPDDKAAAESSVILLAGNLARDEAGDILNGLGKTPSRAPVDAGSSRTRDLELEDLRRLRAFLKEENDVDRRTAVTASAVWIGVGVALSVPGFYLRFADGHDNAKSLGGMLSSTGGLMTLFGTLGLFSRGSLYELVQGQNDDLEALETKLEAHARDARRYRLIGGWLKVGLGASIVGAGVVMTFVSGPHASGEYEAQGLFYGVGAAVTLLGATSLLQESRSETAWRSWKTLRGADAAPKTSSVKSAPIVSAGPVRGGAMVQFGMAF